MPGMCGKGRARELTRNVVVSWGPESNLDLGNINRAERPANGEKVGGVHVTHSQRDTCAGDLCARSCSDKLVTSKEDA